jgi:hypothetical protein
VQKILDIAKRERAADVEHHRQADDLWVGFEVPERGTFVPPLRLAERPVMRQASSSDNTLQKIPCKFPATRKIPSAKTEAPDAPKRDATRQGAPI